MRADELRSNVHAVDTGVLDRLVFELNIARRHVASYPDEHPLIQEALQKTAGLLASLVESTETLTLIIVKDALLVGEESLDRKNPVFRYFASALSNLGIASVTFRRGFTEDELLSFCRILKKDPTEIIEEGGIEAVVEAAETPHLDLRGIDYGALSTTEEESIEVPDDDGAPGSLWERFVSATMEGRIDPEGLREMNPLQHDPELLAGALNATQQETLSSGKTWNYEQTIVSYLRQRQPGGGGGAGGGDHLRNETAHESGSYLSRLIGNLNPELRKQFLTGTLKALGAQEKVAKEVFSAFPTNLVVEALEEVNRQKSDLPPYLMKLLNRLSSMSTPGKPSRNAAAGPDAAVEDIARKIHTVFRQHDTTSFVPDSYQGELDAIMTAEQIGSSDRLELRELQATLAGHVVESHVAMIIFELLKQDPSPEEVEVLKSNLLDLCKFFLEIGDFASLLKIHDIVLRDSGSERVSDDIREGVAQFRDTEFLSDVLNGLEFWGKEKYQDITTLIETIGLPFVDPMLEKLAGAENLSIRRFLIDRLTEMGDTARDAILRRLNDERWYFVRNLVLILRNLDDKSVRAPLHQLLEGSHQKVHLEALRTLLHFGDPKAERMIVRDLESKRLSVRMNALQLAGHSRNPDVFNKVASVIKRSLVLHYHFDLRKAAVNAMVDMGLPQSLVVLRKQLRAWNPVHPLQHGRLKSEIVRALGRFPCREAIGLLEETESSASLSALARQSIDTIRNRGAS